MSAITDMPPIGSTRNATPVWRTLYAQVLFAVALGIAFGWAYPRLGVQVKVLGDLFIRLVRMLLVPIVFASVATGIARLSDLKELGRIGVRTVLYFEIVSTLALLIGVLVANLVKPGAGLNADLSRADTSTIAPYMKQESASGIDFIVNIVPDNMVQALAKGDILPVLFIAVLFGVGLSIKRQAAQPAIAIVESLLEGLFGMMSIVMRFAPLGAFGAMGFTIGRYGLESLVQLGQLLICFYLTCAAFIFLVLGGIAAIAGFSILRFLKLIRAEIAIVLGTCSSESVMPQLLEKLERIGCPRPVVGLVIPAGITFNPDGSAIYLSLATLFIAQATNTPLDVGQQLALLAVMLLTSKGSAGVAGAGFIALAATLGASNALPVAGLALLLGIDRFMNEARAVTNTIGNAVAAVIVSKWEGTLDSSRFADSLNPKATG
jgi:aerobic C4-dicarboxylate transport protein